MHIRQESFGFVVEVDRQGRAPVVLTFEEVYSPRGLSKKYYCCVDVGLYQRKFGRLEFKSLGSFEFDDWFNYSKDIKKREKLKRLIGYETYEELLRKVSLLVNGKLTISNKGYEVV